MSVSKQLRFIDWAKPVLALLLILLVSGAAYGCSQKTNVKGAINNMQTNYIGRFSIAVPTGMEQKLRSSKLRYVEIKEIEWPKDHPPETTRITEWKRFMSSVNQLEPPEGTKKVIIRTNDFPSVGKWVKGLFYYNNSLDDEAAIWTLLMDAGQVGVWLKGNPSVVEKEIISHKMVRNIENIAKSYQVMDQKNLMGQQPGNSFYLQHGIINLPYSAKALQRFKWVEHIAC